MDEGYWGKLDIRYLATVKSRYGHLGIKRVAMQEDNLKVKGRSL